MNPTIIIDSREQAPLVFTQYPSLVSTLQSGDYSILGLCNKFAVERKSISDLIGSLTTGRERFERELHRLRGFHFARLLIIGKESDIIDGNYRSKANPKSIMHSLYSFEARHNVPFVFAETPEDGARLVERWAFWFARDVVKSSEALLRGLTAP